MSKFKTGDRVFCVRRGFGVVTKEETGVLYSINVEFKDDFSEGSRTREGLGSVTDRHPTLFHSPQEAAEYFSKIKRKEKRVVKRWVNIYPDGEVTFKGKESADFAARSTRIACVEIEQEVEYEV